MNMQLISGFVMGWAAAVLIYAADQKPTIGAKTEECTTYGLFTGRKFACTPQEKAALIESGAGK
jgi:hypothetical protein